MGGALWPDDRPGPELSAEEARLTAELSQALAANDVRRIRQAIRAYQEWADQDEAQPGTQPAPGPEDGESGETAG